MKIVNVLPINCTRLAACLLLLTASSTGANQAYAQKAKSGAHPVSHAAARPAPARGPQVSTAQITVYLNRLRSKLIGAWILPDGNNHVTLTGNFNQDGLSDNLKSSSSPKSDAAEDVAMQAFNKCMPLESLPGGMTNARVTVEFISKADPHGDSNSSVNLRLDPVPVKVEPKAEAGKSEPAKAEEAPAASTTPPDKQ